MSLEECSGMICAHYYQNKLSFARENHSILFQQVSLPSRICSSKNLIITYREETLIDEHVSEIEPRYLTRTLNKGIPMSQMASPDFV